jgi:hypothetical protein
MDESPDLVVVAVTSTRLLSAVATRHTAVSGVDKHLMIEHQTWQVACSLSARLARTERLACSSLPAQPSGHRFGTIDSTQTGTFRGSDTTAAVTTSSSGFAVGQLDDLLWRLELMYAPPADLLLHSGVASARDAAALQDAARATTRVTSAAVSAASPDANRAGMWMMLRWLGERLGAT